jgi:hypothetical protein
VAHLLIGFTYHDVRLDILGGCAHLSLKDLVGGQFWENKPGLGFHGVASP